MSLEVAAAMYSRGLVLTNLGDVRGAVEMLREVTFQHPTRTQSFTHLEHIRSHTLHPILSHTF